MKYICLLIVSILFVVIVYFGYQRNKKIYNKQTETVHDTIYVHDTVYIDKRFKIEGQSTNFRQSDKKKTMSLDKK